MRRIRLAKHVATTHATQLEDESVRRHVEQIQCYNLAVQQALALSAQLITANEVLYETTDRLLTESHQRQDELAAARAIQLENETEVQLLHHSPIELTTAEAKTCLKVTSICTNLATATTTISDHTANWAQATKLELKAVREARQLCTDSAKVQVWLIKHTALRTWL